MKFLTFHDEFSRSRIKGVVREVANFHGNFTLVSAIVRELRVVDRVGGSGSIARVLVNRRVLSYLVPLVNW